MTPGQFRKLALSLAETSERAHMGHPDFRVGGRIFATLSYPDERFGMVVLTPQDQEEFIRLHPNVFAPVTGAWGRRGSTRVNLDEVDFPTLRKALTAAWQRRAEHKKTRGQTSPVRGQRAKNRVKR
jgi:hypothetical protein